MASNSRIGIRRMIGQRRVRILLLQRAIDFVAVVNNSISERLGRSRTSAPPLIPKGKNSAASILVSKVRMREIKTPIYNSYNNSFTSYTKIARTSFVGRNHLVAELAQLRAVQLDVRSDVGISCGNVVNFRCGTQRGKVRAR